MGIVALDRRPSVDLHNEGLRLSESHAGGYGFLSPWNVVEATYKLEYVTPILVWPPASSSILENEMEEGARIKEGGIQ